MTSHKITLESVIEHSYNL